MTDETGVAKGLNVRQTGLGLYETTVSLPRVGHATMSFRDTGSDRMKIVHHQADYPREYRLQQQLPDVLEQLPVLHPAAFLDEGALPSARVRRPAQHAALLPAMAAVLGGILCRRLRVR